MIKLLLNESEQYKKCISRLFKHVGLHYIDYSGPDKLQPIIFLHMPKLVKLFIWRRHDTYTEYLNVAMLRAERKKLKNATKLVILFITLFSADVLSPSVHL